MRCPRPVPAARRADLRSARGACGLSPGVQSFDESVAWLASPLGRGAVASEPTPARCGRSGPTWRPRDAPVNPMSAGMSFDETSSIRHAGGGCGCGASPFRPVRSGDCGSGKAHAPRPAAGSPEGSRSSSTDVGVRLECRLNRPDPTASARAGAWRGRESRGRIADFMRRSDNVLASRTLRSATKNPRLIAQPGAWLG